LATLCFVVGYVVLKNKLKELERIQIPAKTFLDKKVEVSYNSEALRVCTDVYASLITVNGLISKPATKLWFNGQRLQKPGTAISATRINLIYLLLLFVLLNQTDYKYLFSYLFLCVEKRNIY